MLIAKTSPEVLESRLELSSDRIPLRDAFSVALRDVLVNVPYSSAASYHQFYGTNEPSLRFGRGCGWQAFEVGGLVERLSGVSATYLFSGAHVAAVYVDQDGITILDPYLPHVEPLRLDRADAFVGTVRAAVDGYPLRVRSDGSPAPSLLQGTWRLDDGALRLAYLRYSPSTGQYRTYREFAFRAGSLLPSVPPPAGLVRRILLLPDQNNLSIRTIHPEDHHVRELVLPFTDRPRAQLVDPAHLITKDNQGTVSRRDTPVFDRDLEMVADAVGATPADVVELVMDAAAIYDRVVPRSIVWPRYAVEDE
jgi:hypothetical protein